MNAGVSPKSLARVAGVFYLLTILTGAFAQGFVADKLVVFGDAATTANNILAHKSLFQWGFTIYLIEMLCLTTTIALFYDLLKPVNKSVSFLTAAVGLAGCAIKTVSRILYIAPLFLLGGAPFLNVFSREQLQALALVFLRVNEAGAGIALAFFGFATVLKGYLIIRSWFLPRVLGVLGLVTGLGLLTFLWPPLGLRLFTLIAALGLIGALPQIVWLLAVGVNEARWKEQAARTSSGA